VLGEGLFVGLGVKIQYPVDFSRSPYTVLACGVTLPPQKVAFPFSLIRAAAEPLPGFTPGTNVLVPAWMLSDNLYAVERATQKFGARDRATRHELEHQAFRPGVMALVANACERLERATGKEIYTERDLPGLGRNVLFERHRLPAVRCYRSHLERCALLRLLDSIDEGGMGRTPPARPGCGAELRESLARLSELLHDYAMAVERSKARDEERGPLVIDDYADAHVPTADDQVIRQTWDEVRAAQAHVARTLAALTPVRQPDGGRAVTVAPVAGS
jgi:hypothetical protein